ncbi:hypothetical protein SEPCBS57363_004948 [Sporothrix epigloea]|uniref:Uncharacterized protein n=1 Tax=Sporothrix epigloea TaxID=1892477 RepID=A0ABP0DV52_9PEZI
MTTSSRATTTSTPRSRSHPSVSLRLSLPDTSRLRRPVSTRGRSSEPSHPVLLRSSTASSHRLLHPRDRNAVLSPRPATPRFLRHQPSSSTMGYDKDTPRKPILASRPIARAPLTPKIAGSVPTTPSLARAATVTSSSSVSPSYHTVTVSTPLARRATGQSSTSSHVNLGHNNDSSASPVPSYLHNVTPRSGSRQSRVDSTTPTGTPTQTQTSSNSVMGLTSPADPDAKFFYASEAKSSSTSAFAAASTNSTAPSSSASMGPLLASPGLSPAPRSAPTFFHANGRPLPSGSNGNSPAAASAPTLPAHLPPNAMVSPTLSSANMSSAADLSSKFVHANGAALEHTPISSTARRTPVSPTAQQQGSRPLSPMKLATMATYPLHKSMSFPVVAQTSAAISSVVNGSTNNNIHHRPSVPTTLSLNAAASATGPPVTVASPTSPQPLSGPGSPGSVRFDMLSRQRSNFSASIGSNSSADGHSRKASLTVADPPTVARLLHSSQPSSEMTSPVSIQSPAYPFPNVASSPGGGHASAAATGGLAAILQAADDLVGDDDGGGGDSGSVKGHSENDGDDSDCSGQTNAGKDSRRSSANGSTHPDDPNTQQHLQQHSHQQLDELVAIARRERKVQDLEITNASLEAINRSLERQLRKQKNELRQFRRLSRSGRLSLAPLAGRPGSDAIPGSSRITSSSTVEGPMQDLDRLLGDDESFVDSDKDDSDRENSFNEHDQNQDHDHDSFDNNSENDRELDLDNENLTRRKRDERRLQLDLAQHHQLLVDSQKMNQSIKRCMKWTEALIQEGQKALEFEVRVSEVQLGGRVLAADEVEEREREQQKRNSQEQSERVSLLLEQTQTLLDEHDEEHDEGKQDEPSKHGEATKAMSEIALSSSSNSTAGLSMVPTPTASSSSSSDEHDDCNEAFSPINRYARTVRFDDSGDTAIQSPTPPTSPSKMPVSPILDTGITPDTLCKPSAPPPLPEAPERRESPAATTAAAT